MWRSQSGQRSILLTECSMSDNVAMANPTVDCARTLQFFAANEGGSR